MVQDIHRYEVDSGEHASTLGPAGPGYCTCMVGYSAYHGL